MCGDGIGLALGEVKGLLERLQGIVAAEHAQAVVSANSSCGACGLELPRKGEAGIVYRTAFGKLRLSGPRLYSQCRSGARAHDSESFSPLAMVVAERTHPELLYLQTRWASVVSYERAAKLMEDVLPIDAAPLHQRVRRSRPRFARSALNWPVANTKPGRTSLTASRCAFQRSRGSTRLTCSSSTPPTFGRCLRDATAAIRLESSRQD